MKPSSFDWLGDIPAHGEVQQLRRLRQYLTSGSRDWAAYYADEGEPFLRMTNVTGDGIELDLVDLRFVDLEGVTEGTRTSVIAGDILITITAELGSVAIARKNVEGAYINQHLALFRPDRSRCSSDFLVNFLSTDMARAQFTLSGQGGTKQGLGFEQVNNVVLGLPPRDEQEVIGTFCAELWRRFQAAERPMSLAVDRLIEYRAAIITAAVTGKMTGLQ
jgi:type I restriction enzyme S subunit